MKEPIRILVFGETGTGKTSVCNSLSNEYKPVSDQAVGVTFQSQNYLPFIFNEDSYILTDTVGLNEGDNGTVKATAAFKNLLELINNSKNGYNILVQVMRGRITKSLCDNYKFFVETVADKKIPVILVVTGCENSDPMAKWETENKSHFERAGLEYKSILATCFATSDVKGLKETYEILREESNYKVMNAIVQYSLIDSFRLYKNERGLVRILKHLWNGVCELFEIDSWKVKINDSLRNLLIRVGFTEREATDLADKWSVKKKNK